MTKWTSKLFVENIIHDFGEYKKSKGMPDIIQREMELYTPETMQELYNLLIKNYKAYNRTPPTLAHILDLAKKENVKLVKKKNAPDKMLMWRCGQCNNVYDYDTSICPNTDCGKRTNALPVSCPCGEYFPDDFGCGVKLEEGYCQTRVEGVCNDRREQAIECKGCGKVWTYFPRDQDPHIYGGRCKKCGKPRESGRIIRRG